LSLLDASFGRYVGGVAKAFCEERDLTAELIGWHGHTVFHNPEYQSTFQIGNGGALAATSGIAVINQFRQIDMALGGQGAPLAPIADELLMDPADFFLNLGGISNISFRDSKGVYTSFDVGPCNQILNRLANELDQPYDDQGKIAATGSLITSLLSELDSLEYYKAPYPKSLDNNWINAHVWPILEKSNATIEDKLCTFSHHVADQIAQVIRAHSPEEGVIMKTVVTGGGAYNAFVITLLEDSLQDLENEVILPSPELIEFKEAALMGLMAYLFVRGIDNVYQTVTGSSMDHIGGCLFQAPGKPLAIYG